MPEHYGPEGDPARHLDLDALARAFEALPAPPADQGRVRLLVARRADGVRETPSRVELTPEEGMPGDRWARRTRGRPEMQLAVIQHDVAELIANGQPPTILGDNLFVELDLSSENLPAGSRLRVGAATCEVTPEPHDGCRKFRGRVGAAALRWVSDRTRRHRNLRGVYWRVIEPGAVAVGDPIRVLSRTPAGTAPPGG